MFRLVHISDVHLGPLPPVSIRQLASKRITGYLNWQIARRKHHHGDVTGEILNAIAAVDPSHVAITGDLINLGLETEIENASLWLQALGPPEFVSVVPGNHDAYVPGAFSRICNAWRAWMQGDHPHMSGVPFPYLRVREDVALIGISSARASAPFMATGYFRKLQAKAVEQLLAEAKRKNLFRIIMIHHSPIARTAGFRRRLVGASLFRWILKRHGAELVLHGHTHLPTLDWLEGAGGAVPVVGVAAAGQAPGGPKPAAQFNLFEIDGGPGRWRTVLTRHGIEDLPGNILKVSHTELHGAAPEAVAARNG